MPFTHKSNGVLKENDVSFFEEHDVSMFVGFFHFLMVILAMEMLHRFFEFSTVKSNIDRRWNGGNAVDYGSLHN